MPAQQKVSNEQIRQAMEQWEGVVVHAAAAVGIHPKNLRERLRRMGLDPEAFRNGAIRTGTHGVVRMGRLVVRGPKTSGDTFSVVGGSPTLSSMQAAAKETEDDVAPIRTAPRKQMPARIRPDLRDQIERAVWDLQAKHGVPTDFNLILEQYIEEGFASWVADKMKGPAAKNGKKNGGEPR